MPNLKPIVFLCVVVVAFALGWRINEWRHDSNKLAAVEAGKTATIEVKEKAEQLDVTTATAEVVRTEKVKVVTKEVIRYVQVTNPADRCELPATWRVRHDAAARGEYPSADGENATGAGGAEDVAGGGQSR